MNKPFTITKQDIIDYRANRGREVKSNDRLRLITIGKLSISDINEAWGRALSKHQF